MGGNYSAGSPIVSSQMTNINYLNLTLITFAKGQLGSLKTAITPYL